MLTFGQFLTIANTKYLYLIAITVFELGSLICGVSPNINVLIFGRAVQGVGASGIFISVLTVIGQVTRLEDRPILFGSFGGVFAFASVVGPLLGGAFTDNVTWRWCFYINLPFGAISIAAVAIWLPANPPVESQLHKGMTQWQKWRSLDWLGSVLSLGTIVPLLLALQWGGQTKPWDDRAVIACFAVVRNIPSSFHSLPSANIISFTLSSALFSFSSLAGNTTWVLAP
jgi:MFS family permease